MKEIKINLSMWVKDEGVFDTENLEELKNKVEQVIINGVKNYPEIKDLYDLTVEENK